MYFFLLCLFLVHDNTINTHYNSDGNLNLLLDVTKRSAFLVINVIKSENDMLSHGKLHDFMLQ